MTIELDSLKRTISFEIWSAAMVIIFAVAFVGSLVIVKAGKNLLYFMVAVFAFWWFMLWLRRKSLVPKQTAEEIVDEIVLKGDKIK